MHLIVVGLSHKTAPIEIREKLTFPEHRQEEALSLLSASDEVAEAAILSTCNRTEIYTVCSSLEGGRAAILDFLADYHELDRHELARYLYDSEDAAVVLHLFRVVASLDSMVVGEAQILGQCKDAYECALEYGSTGRVLNKLFRQSFQVGKRVRTETEIGESAVSISYAAIELAKKVFNTMDGKTVLILGAGKMSELTAKHLVANGVRNVLVANRTFERAEELAKRFDGKPIAWDDMLARMHDADIVISSTGAPHYVVTKEMVSGAMKGRSGRPLFLIDIAVPRDIEPTVNDVGGAYLYDIDDLNGVVESNLDERMKEARRAEAIIEEEMAEFGAWLEGMEVVPTIAAIRTRAEKIRQAEYERALKRLGGLSEKELATVEKLTESIVNKMLHDPTSGLRQAAGRKDGYEMVETVRRLYALDEPSARGASGLLKELFRFGEKSAQKKEMGDTLGI
jgi:glutamyl-tRNA reductase